MNESLKAEVRKSAGWKFLFWSQLVLVLLWIGLRNVPILEEKGAVGAVDFLMVLLVFVFAMIWLLFLSRLKWRVRLIGTGVILGLLGGMVKIDGHTGSFFPQFSWRWSKDPATEIPKMTGKMAEEGTVIETEGLENFPRLLGSEMKNWVSDELLPDGWYQLEPKELWRAKLGEGWSGF
ncbi:hypothetical protein OAF84_02740, partial [Akkermansiaceae bacterium]|nr:hypothetical protein [Akkermansiaceae bacterium]